MFWISCWSIEGASVEDLRFQAMVGQTSEPGTIVDKDRVVIPGASRFCVILDGIVKSFRNMRVIDFGGNRKKLR